MPLGHNRHRQKQKLSTIRPPKSKKNEAALDEEIVKKYYGIITSEENTAFYVSPYVAFKAIFCFRIISAIWFHISDPDETFNYWEPSHYLLFNYGFQTWEYSPKYALKSYLYLLIHVVPAWIYNELFHPSRLLLFYFTRCFLAVICTVSEVFFYKGVCREFGVNVGSITLIILIFSPGMFVASTAFLPSSFCMYVTLMSMASWFYRKHALALFLSILSSLISWPLAAITGFPIVYEMLILRRKWKKFLSWFILSTCTALVFSIDTDSSYYGKFTFVPWNVIKYTLSSSDSVDSSDQPWYFYIVSGFLNFNISFLIVFLTPFLLIWIQIVLPKKYRNPDSYPYKLSLEVLFFWLIIFCLRQSKKEHYLYPIYPLIALNAAIGIDAIQIIWFRHYIRKGYHYTKQTLKISLTILTCCCLLGGSRMLALYKASHAQMDIFIELTNVNANLSEKVDVNLCMEKDWKRFSSSYFLPDKWKMNFVKTERGDEVPGYFVESTGGNVVQKSVNFNEQKLTKYVNIDRCDYMIDSDDKDLSSTKSSYSNHSNWTAIYTSIILDSQKTNSLVQSFYIPMVWESFSQFSRYHLLKRNRIRSSSGETKKKK